MAILEVENLIKKYGEKKALNDVSFALNECQAVGFVGPNGGRQIHSHEHRDRVYHAHGAARSKFRGKAWKATPMITKR